MEFKQRLAELPRRFLDNASALAVLRANPGYLPIRVLPQDGGKILWLDVGAHHFSEAKFSYALENILKREASAELLETEIDLLRGDNPFVDSVPPQGFIFFVHRCGTTLLAKALAQPAHNLVLNEADALHEELWVYLSQNWTRPIEPTPDNLELVRNLILALARHREPRVDTCFFKFNPWHTVFMDFIHAAFPRVPSLFMYRNPTEIIVSVVKAPAPIMSHIQGTPFAAELSGLSAQQTLEVSYEEYFAHIYGNFMRKALTSSIPLSYLNYNLFTAANLPVILEQAFGYVPPAEDLALLQGQFNYYSKDDSNSTRFSSDKARKQSMATEEIHRAVTENELNLLYARLEQTPENLSKYLDVGNIMSPEIPLADGMTNFPVASGVCPIPVEPICSVN